MKRYHAQMSVVMFVSMVVFATISVACGSDPARCLLIFAGVMCVLGVTWAGFKWLMLDLYGLSVQSGKQERFPNDSNPS